MDGKIFDSEGLYVAYVLANAVYDLSSNKRYALGSKYLQPDRAN
ncbi:hypothetical protein ABIE49_005958 [Bradyrhizobium sp. OAE829]|jgi:hypothetical protein